MDNNLDYNAFINRFTNELQKTMDKYCEYESYSMDLIREKDILVVCYSDSNIGPVLHLDDKYFLYEDGHNIDDLVDLTMKQLEYLKEKVQF